jgi:hypothetical protein
MRFRPRGEHYGQAAVVAGSGPGGDAIHDFTLQHHVHVFDRCCVIEQVKEQRRGNVVRQVAHDAQAATALGGERCEIEIERVGFVDGDARVARELLAQRGREVAVDLDEVESGGAAVGTLSGRSGSR